MSLILDALKRAERERKLEKAPDLSAIYQEEHPGSRKARQWFWLGGAVLVVFVALAVLFWPETPPKPTLTASTSAKGAPTKSASASKPAAPKAVKQTPPSAAALSAKETQPKTKKQTTVSEKPSAVVSKEADQTPVSAEGPTEKIPETPVAVAPPPKQDIADPEPAPEPVKPPVASAVEESGSTSGGKIAPEAKPKEALPFFDDLPENIQSVSGPLEINVHMYSSKPSERRVFINMQGYREGDVIGESGYKLVEITSNGVVIDYGQGKALLQVKRK
jgi:general secretion pathway protein B